MVDILRSCTIFLNRIFNCGVTSAHYTCTCILVVTILKMTTWVTETCPWLLTYSMEQSPSEEANRFSASQEIPSILRNPKVHHRIHKSRHLSLSWASSIQSMLPHPTSWRSILILFSHIRLDLPSGLFPSGFPTKTLCTPLLSPVRATRLARDYCIIKLNSYILEHPLAFLKKIIPPGIYHDGTSITSPSPPSKYIPFISLNILPLEVTQFHKLTAP